MWLQSGKLRLSTNTGEGAPRSPQISTLYIIRHDRWIYWSFKVKISIHNMLLGNLITSTWIHSFLFPFLSQKGGCFLVLSLTPFLASSWRPCSSSFPTIACQCCPLLWVAVANSRGSKAGTAAAAATAATLTLLWLKNLHKLLKVATGVLLGNISEGHFDASNSSLFLLRCL